MKRKRHIRLKNKKRFVIFLSSILILIVISMMNLFTQTLVWGTSKNTYMEVLVKKGDTLWSIAERYNSNNKDIRKFINEIMRENNINSAMLMHGDTLKIPIY